jgi:hypothetical protein
MATQYILEQIRIEGALQDLIAKSTGDYVTVSYNSVTQSLTNALASILTGINGKADSDTVTTLSDNLATLIGSDSSKSTRTIAGEVLAAAGKLTRTIVASVDAIDAAADHADEYIYMVPKAEAKTGDKYDEYMVIDGAVEKVGDWNVDLSNYLQKLSTFTADDIIVVNTDGSLKDSGTKLDQLATRVTGATNGHLAALDADGNLTDSGKAATDFVEKESGKGLSTNDYSATEKQKVADAYDAKHTHSNKDLLDTYTQTETDLADAVTKKHEHSNKTELDKIESGDKAKWDAIRGVRTGTSVPDDMQDGEIFVRIVTTE